jgi:hypothetical protein
MSSRIVWLPIAATLVVMAGCRTDSAPDATDSAVAARVSATGPLDQQTPFCRVMTSDIEGDIAAAYRAILPDAPAEIASDLQAVIDRLESGRPVTQTGPTVATAVDDTTTLASGGSTLPEAEVVGRVPDDDPAGRLYDYVEFTCRGVANNPGAPPTQPEIVVESTVP